MTKNFYNKPKKSQKGGTNRRSVQYGPTGGDTDPPETDPQYYGGGTAPSSNSSDSGTPIDAGTVAGASGTNEPAWRDFIDLRIERVRSEIFEKLGDMSWGIIWKTLTVNLVIIGVIFGFILTYTSGIKKELDNNIDEVEVVVTDSLADQALRLSSLHNSVNDLRARVLNHADETSHLKLDAAGSLKRKAETE
ncbi:MAG: hypothetical protein H8E26_14285 [FCB group bacterium]|nr:hypothetical protein [FCB group bacterium]MBL7027453.1 hypothetical protein [Candidatus Neomarinimicrobiota bacterium]MBL7122066.1 hypothetical protein [Candidatus Neomarinimicrobiota bacterium]